MRRLFYISCVLQTWQRPTLPRLKTKYHGRRGVSRPCSERERVQPPRHNHQVGKAQLYVLRSWQALACFLNTSFGTSSGCGCLWHPYRPEAVANRLAGRPQRHWRVRTKVWIIDPDEGKAFAGSGRTLRVRLVMSIVNENDQADRAISTGKLHALPHFHTRPINVVVFHGSDREYSFSGGFPA